MPKPQHAAPSTASTATRALLALVGVAVIAAGAIVGVLWGQRNADIYVADARVAFANDVGIGALDAERERIVDSAAVTGREQAEALGSVRSIDYTIPLGRIFIDVEVSANDPELALDATTVAVDALIATEAADALAERTAEIDKLRAAREIIDPRVVELEAQMEILLAQEAAAEARRAGAGGDSAVVEEAIVAARTASDEYWKLARERNSLLDQQGAYTREILVLEAEGDEGNLRVVRAAAPIDDDAVLDEPLRGGIGGAVFGLILVLLAAAALSSRR